VVAPPSVTELRKIWKLSGLPIAKLFNTSGESYRNGGYAARLKTFSDDEALTALSRDGKLIKRPLVVGTDFALVGFNESAYEQRLGKVSK
jgi:arsenate reductase (glutaredoxin)